MAGRAFSLVKKASQSSPPEAANSVKSFFAGACTWRKILLTQRASQRLCRKARSGVQLKKVLALF